MKYKKQLKYPMNYNEWKRLKSTKEKMKILIKDLKKYNSGQLEFDYEM
jgi:hypothetical protein